MTPGTEKKERDRRRGDRRRGRYSRWRGTEVRRQVEESEGKRGNRMIEGGEEMRKKKGSENR